MSSKVQNLFILIGLIAIAGIGYYLYAQNGDMSLKNNAVDNQAAADTADFLYRLNDLKSIQLDGSIFEDPRFTTLVDSSEAVIPSYVGRENPFTENN